MKIITLSFTALMTFSAFSVMKSCSGTNIVSHRLTSPDGNITVEFDVSQKGEATYQIACHGKKIIQASRLGLVREDANWDWKIGYDKVAELAAYAQTKGVGILLWYNSSGDWNSTTYSPKSKLLTHSARLREFERL